MKRSRNFIAASTVEALQPAILGSSWIYLSVGVAPKDVAFLKTVFLLTTVILDIPTSAAAKVLGSELAFVIGKTIHICGLILLFVCLAFEVNCFFAVELLFGMGTAFVLGLRSAISCEFEADLNRRAALISKIQTTFYLATAFSFLVFSDLFDPFSLERQGLVILTAVTSSAAAFLMIKGLKPIGSARAVLNNFWGSLSISKSYSVSFFRNTSQQAKNAVATHILMAGLFIAIQELIAPVVKIKNFDFGSAAIFLATAVFASALGSAISNISTVKRARSEILLALVVVCCAFSFFSQNQYELFGGLVVIAFFKGLLTVRLLTTAAQTVGELSGNPLFHSFCNLTATVFGAIILSIAAALSYSPYFITSVSLIIFLKFQYLKPSPELRNV